MTLCRRDAPYLVGLVILIALFLLSASARADAVPNPLEEIAKEAAQQVAAPGWLNLAGNITTVGLLWYFVRRGQDSNDKKEAQILEQEKRLTALATNYENFVRELRDERRGHAFSKSQQLPHNAG